MNPQSFILSKLRSLSGCERIDIKNKSVTEFIIKRITSKKFRKYAIDETLTKLIESVVEDSVINNKPIPFVWVFGGYKLFSLPVAPQVDWAELFSLMYFSEWLLPISSVYKPGVVFDFYSDDIIVPQMNNIDPKATKDYLLSFINLLKFFKKYLPKNMIFTLTRVVDQYPDPKLFVQELEQNIQVLEQKYLDSDFILTDAQKAMISLNVKLLPNQDRDPKWMQKVQLIHDAYAMSSKRRPYYKSGNKIPVLNSAVKGFLPIGTTKNSIVKFWVGMGVLEKNKDSFKERILSPKQIQTVTLKPSSIQITDLKGENFKTININVLVFGKIRTYFKENC